MNLNSEITELLNQRGCNIIGFANLCSLPQESRQGFDYGILIALSFSKEAMLENKIGLPQRYSDEHDPMTKRLDALKKLLEDFLVGKGYDVCIDTPASIVDRDLLRSLLPLKTVGTLAGIGWIGKNAMLVTNEVGAALRITALLTNAPIECGVSICKSKCPTDCTICADVCPGNAPLGGIWETGLDRDSFFDAFACQTAGRSRAKELLDIDDETRCGLCISNCPFTKQGLGYE